MPLPSFSGDIEKNIIRHIKYRGTIRTGEIIVDNGDGTYDVKIALSDVVYPSIETVHYEMVFAVGEIAVLAFEYGSKENPKIIGHGKKIAQTPVEVEVDYSGTARVETLDAYSILALSAYLEGRIYLGGAGNCTERGFHYGTSTGYELPDVSSTGSFAAGSYNEQVTGLTSDTTYHFQAYVLDADGDEHTGDDKIFTTTTIVSVPKIFVYLWDATDDYCIKSYTTDGTFIATIKSELSDFTISRRDTMCVDSDDNVYYLEYFDTIKKLDKDGNLLLSKDITWGEAIAIGPDGFIYVREFDSEWNDCIIKRNRSDLEIVSTIAFTSVDGYQGLVLDADSYIYSYDKYTDLEKWDFASGVMVASRALVSSEVSLSVVGSLVGGLFNASPPNQYAWTIPTSLGEDKTDWDLDGIARPFCTSSIGSNFLYGGSLKIAKYQINRTKVWETAISDNNTIYQMAAYPF